jgi:MFS family permease
MNDDKNSNRELVSVITASAVGTLIEWYDFFVFGSLSIIISTHFFPKDNPVAAYLATLATYAAGLVVRPFGALFFGRLGDLIGRKYTFMVTLLLMGGTTFAIGLVPDYQTIGFMAPVIILILRLLQGLAIGGEYGGAATFVAEHSSVNERGFWTSWIQITAAISFLLTLLVILVLKKSMAPSAWETWGWRLPFLISVLMVGVSVYIRKNMAESPLFAKAKAEGKTSSNPLAESFGNKANLKLVLLALFGITIGIGGMNWSSLFYVQTYFTIFLSIDYDQVNTIIIIGVVLAIGFTIFFGWLSDRVGRKPLIMLSLFLAVICYRPMFEFMYQTVNLNHKTEILPAVKTATKTTPIPALPGATLVTTTTNRLYSDGTSVTEIKKEQQGKVNISKTITLNSTDKWKLILVLFLLLLINVIGYSALAAFLVEMFPLKIRYSSMSLPYHVGFGIFGGLCPVIATYMIQKDKLGNVGDYYLSGLKYPLVLMCLSLLIGVLYLKENEELKPVFTIPSLPIKLLNILKQYLGFVWILLGLAAAYFGVIILGIPKLNSGNQDDVIFGIIVLFFITPIATLGLLLFGKYSLSKEYDE